MNDDLIGKIVKDLESSGFGSEMRAVDVALTEDWKVEGNSTYLDRDSGGSREIDIVALRPSHATNGSVRTWIHLAIEVKKSKNPWVVHMNRSVHPALLGGGWRQLIWTKDLPCERPEISEDVSSGSLSQKLGWRGFSIHESFKKPGNRSKWYPAFVTASKAAQFIIDRRPELDAAMPDEFREQGCLFDLAQPVVVLDGVLFSAELSNTNEIAVARIDSAPFEFVFGSAEYERKSYFVDVVTLAGLRSYLRNWVERQELIRDALTSYLQ